MNAQIEALIKQCTSWSDGSTWTSHEEFDKEKFAELILANYAELTRSTDPINKPFELNPKFVATCDELGRNRRQFK